MDWAEQVDGYCERLDFSFWAEPLNAASNLAFIVAALICWRMRPRDGAATFLTLVLFAIGVGSFLFHTFATRWAGVADVLPILIFILTYIYAATRRFVGLGWLGSAGAAAVSLALMVLVPALWPLPPINGSEGYVAVLLIMLGYAAYLSAARHPAAPGLWLTAVLLALSLTARSVDDALCAALPFGTHFIWHLLNGLLLGLVLATYIRHGTTRLAPAPRGG